MLSDVQHVYPVEGVDVCVYCWLHAALRMVLVVSFFFFCSLIAFAGAMNGVYMCLFDFGQENGVSAFFVFGFASHPDRWSPLFGFGPMYDIIQYC